MKEPIIIESKSGLAKNIPFLLMGVAWTGMLTFAFVSIIQQPDAEVSPALLFMALFFLVGIGIFFIGLRGIHHTLITVSASEVKYSRKGVARKTVEWTEPLNTYSGIAFQSRMVSRGKHNHITLYDVVLKHADEKKTLILESYRDQQEQRSRQEFLTKELQLPSLETGADGTVRVRQTEDLDKNIKELVQEGKVKRTFASRNPYPQKKYRMVETKDGFVLKRTYYQYFFWGALIWGIAVFLLSNIPRDVYGFVLAVTVIGGFMFFSGFSKEMLGIVQNKIIYRMTIFGFFQQKHIIIPLDKIEEISISHDYSMGNVKRFNKAIKVASDTGTFHFCHYTSDAEREWIADKLIDLSVKEKADSEII